MDPSLHWVDYFSQCILASLSKFLLLTFLQLSLSCSLSDKKNTPSPLNIRTGQMDLKTCFIDVQRSTLLRNTASIKPTVLLIIAPNYASLQTAFYFHDSCLSSHMTNNSQVTSSSFCREMEFANVRSRFYMCKIICGNLV